MAVGHGLTPSTALTARKKQNKKIYAKHWTADCTCIPKPSLELP
jgi:hypothetical protein